MRAVCFVDPLSSKCECADVYGVGPDHSNFRISKHLSAETLLRTVWQLDQQRFINSAGLIPVSRPFSKVKENHQR